MGIYRFKRDTILFSKIPDDIKHFVPNKILYDKKQKAIFIEKDVEGKFICKKEELNHFKLDSIYNP